MSQWSPRRMEIALQLRMLRDAGFTRREIISVAAGGEIDILTWCHWCSNNPCTCAPRRELGGQA